MRLAKCFLILFFIPALSFARQLRQLPNPKLTPGESNPFLTKEVICAKSFRTGAYRNVPLAEKKAVMKAYGLPWSDHKLYEFDHLIPLEIGGSNSIENIWPQHWAEAKAKDVVENDLHRHVCDDRLDLGAAQKAISNNWGYILFSEDIPW